MLASGIAQREGGTFAEKYPAYMTRYTAVHLLNVARLINGQLRVHRAVRRLGEW